MSSAAALRNREPIARVLVRVLPSTGSVLEIASGTGEHVVHFARHMPYLEWQPSDPDTRSRASIEAWIDAEGLSNVRPPIALDVKAPWPVTSANAIVCINMIHIAPWEATLALVATGGRLLADDEALFLYGPFKRGGQHTAPSNAEFDTWLQASNDEWGVRDLDEVAATAAAERLVLEEIIEMPANNLSVVLRKAGKRAPAAG